MGRHRRRLAIFPVLVLLSNGLTAAGRELQVPAGHPTIQAAIQAAGEGDTVLVSAGTYRELLVISGKSLTLNSESGQEETLLEGADQGTVITLRDAGFSTIQGFTIAGGARAPTRGIWAGGGVLVTDSSPLLSGNVFRRNRGAGVQISGRSSGAVIENDLFEDNQFGVWVEDGAAATIRACRFERNATSVTVQGPSRASVINCRLSALPNAFLDTSTGLEAADGAQVRVVQSIFQRFNTGVALWGAFRLEITNCLFFEVSTAVRATAAGKLLRIRNTIFANNFEDLEVVEDGLDPGGVLLPELITNLSYPRAASFAEGRPPARSGKDPLFIDARGGDFRLGAGSPALDAGTAGGDLPGLDLAGQPRVSGAGIDLGPFEGAHGPGTSLDPVTLSVPGDAPTIQEAIAGAISGDEVLVAPGTYRENLDFLGRSISVVSSGGRASTALIPQKTAEPAVKVEVPEGGFAKLSGFRIPGGEGFQTGVLGRGDVELSDLEVRGFSWAGIESSGRIVECVSAGNGTGVLLRCCSRFISTQVLECLIEENWRGIGFTGPGTTRIAGNTVRGNRYFGLEASDTGLNVLEHNLFEANEGGVFLEEVVPGVLVRFNTFRGNRGLRGGALRIGTPVEVVGNVFEGNTASESGGAVSIWGPSAALRSNLFASNSAPSGGALEVVFTYSGQSVKVAGNTFSGNAAQNGAGVLVTGLTDPESALFIGNIFWGNRTPSGASDLSGLGPEGVFACDVEEPGFAGRNGNISLDPRFTDPAREDFHLRADSPCIDRGAPPPPSPGDDLEDTFGHSDFERDARVLDGDGDGVPAPDMGYDELDPGPGVRVGDCNGSRSVDLSDAVEILSVLFQGAGTPPCLEACDADRDGTVSLTDALGLLASLFGSPRVAVSLPDLDRCRSREGGGSCASSSCP